MENKDKKRHKGKKAVLAVVIMAAGAGGVWFYLQNQPQNSTQTLSGKEETVQKGTITAGILEDGSVTYGTNSQIFTVSEITEVDTSDSESENSETASAGTETMANGAGMEQSSNMAAGGTASQIQSQSDSTSSSETSLEVETVYAASGQVVKTGDPILKITEESIENYRGELEAAVQSARLNVQKEEINVESKRAEADYTYEMYLAEGETAEETYQATITSLENDVADLEEELSEAEEEVADLEEELSWGYDVEDDLEEAQLNYDTTEANLRIAKNSLRTGKIEAKQTYENALTNYEYAEQLYEIDTNGLEDDLNDAEEVLQDAEEAQTNFEEQIGDGIIYAEYDGTISSVAYAAGDEIVSEAEVVAYTDAENVTIAVSVTQEDIAEVAVGDTVSISLDAYEDETFDGEVQGISTSSTGTSAAAYEVTVRFTGDTSKVYSGMTGEVLFAQKSVTDVLYIPNKAVSEEENISYVNVLQEDGSIKKTEIETGFSDGSVVEVISGLTEGQTLLIESQVAQ